MELSLIIRSGKLAGREVAIRSAKYLLGQGEDCQLRLKDPQVAERHCALCVKGDDVVLRVFESPGGTSVNGKPIQKAVRLKHGDVLRLGQLEFEVKVVLPPEVDEEDIFQWIADESAATAADTMVRTAIADAMQAADTEVEPPPDPRQLKINGDQKSSIDAAAAAANMLRNMQKK